MRYLGKIEVASGTAKTNANTAVPFTIPDAKGVLRLRSDAAVTIATGAAPVADAATGFPVAATTDTAIPKAANTRKLSVRNDSGGAAVVKVWME